MWEQEFNSRYDVVIFTFCALLGHMAGALCRFVKHRDLNPLGRL
jgi:hypothetical protein